jgi:hypothetical protein
MKKLFKLRYWFSVLLPCLLITLNGCKKENANEKLTDAQQIENAKSWFSEQQKNQITTFMNIKGKEINLTFVPGWKNAAVAHIGNAIIITTTVKTNLQSIYGESTQFNLVIKNEDNRYDLKILKIRPNDEGDKENILDAAELYKTAFTNDDLSSEQLNAEIKIYNAHFKSNGTILYTATGRTMIAEEKPSSNWKPYIEQQVDDHKIFTARDLPKKMALQCYDAYMVTRVYVDGVLVDIYQEYLGFQICKDNENESLNPEDLNNPGAPNQDNDYSTNINLDFGEATNTSLGNTVVIDLDTFKVSDLTWKFHSGPSYYWKSVERGAVKVKNGAKTFYSLHHQGHSRVGSVYYGEVNIKNFTSTPHVNNWRAFINITYIISIKVETPIYNQTYDSDVIPNSCGWNVNFEKD